MKTDCEPSIIVDGTWYRWIKDSKKSWESKAGTSSWWFYVSEMTIQESLSEQHMSILSMMSLDLLQDKSRIQPKTNLLPYP